MRFLNKLMWGAQKLTERETKSCLGQVFSSIAFCCGQWQKCTPIGVKTHCIIGRAKETLH